MTSRRCEAARLIFISLVATVAASAAWTAQAAPAATPSATAPVSGASAAGASGDVIAEGGHFSLGAADVRALVDALPDDQRAEAIGSVGNLEQVVRGEIARRAVLAEAKAGDFARQPDTAAALERVRDEALIRLWVAKQEQVPAGYPTEADVQTAYDANKAALAAPTEYRLGQIFISVPDHAADAAKSEAAFKKAAELEAKLAVPTADFSELAHQYSDDAATAAKGGDLGYLPENRLTPEVLAAVRDLAGGQVAGPLKTALGLHFLKLLDKRPGAVPTLAEAHARLVLVLRARRAQQLEQAYLTALNTKLAVTVNQIELEKVQKSLGGGAGAQ